MEAFLRLRLADCIGKLDAVVLGCTHYPLAAEAISKVLGDGVVLLDGGAGTARETRRRLEAAQLLEEGAGEVILRNSSGSGEMLRICHELLNQER